MLTRTHK